MTLEEALTKIEELRKRLRKAQRNAACVCPECGGYWMVLGDGGRACKCVPNSEETEASK